MISSLAGILFFAAFVWTVVGLVVPHKFFFWRKDSDPSRRRVALVGGCTVFCLMIVGVASQDQMQATAVLDPSADSLAVVAEQEREADKLAEEREAAEFLAARKEYVDGIMGELLNTGLIRRVETHTATVYVNPLLWQSLNIDQKRQAAAIMARSANRRYIEDFPGVISIHDHQSGKRLARMTALRGFLVD
jgi:hypothetical protein